MIGRSLKKAMVSSMMKGEPENPATLAEQKKKQANDPTYVARAAKKRADDSDMKAMAEKLKNKGIPATKENVRGALGVKKSGGSTLPSGRSIK